MNSYYTEYIVIGGNSDGRRFPRTPAGLAEAMLTDGDMIRPFRPMSLGLTGEIDVYDLDDYGGEVDRGNAGVFAKS